MAEITVKILKDIKELIKVCFCTGGTGFQPVNHSQDDCATLLKSLNSMYEPG